MADGGSRRPGRGPGEAADEVAVRLLGRLFTLSPRLVELQDLGAREYGMGYARGRVLWALRSSGPVLMRALSEALGVTPRTITGLVDALEADGWVERRAHPTDRRATLIAITPAADAALARLDEAYRGLARDLLGGIAPGDLRGALAVVDQIMARLDDVVARGMAALPPRPRLGRGGSAEVE